MSDRSKRRVQQANDEYGVKSVTAVIGQQGFGADSPNLGRIVRDWEVTLRLGGLLDDDGVADWVEGLEAFGARGFE